MNNTSVEPGVGTSDAIRRPPAVPPTPGLSVAREYTKSVWTENDAQYDPS